MQANFVIDAEHAFWLSGSQVDMLTLGSSRGFLQAIFGASKRGFKVS